MMSIKLSVPILHNSELYDGIQNRYHDGLLGATGGLEYYFDQRFSLNMDYLFITDRQFLPAEETLGQSFFQLIDLQLGTDFKHFHFDIGVQGNQNFYNTYTYTTGWFGVRDRSLVSAHNQYSLGLAFSTYYKITDFLNLGINYYPSFIGWPNNKMESNYSYLSTVDLIFKIRTNDPLKTMEILKKQW
jgi:hypothetical protein